MFPQRHPQLQVRLNAGGDGQEEAGGGAGASSGASEPAHSGSHSGGHEDKRRCFEQARKQHYNMRAALQRCGMQR